MADVFVPVTAEGDPFEPIGDPVERHRVAADVVEEVRVGTRKASLEPFAVLPVPGEQVDVYVAHASALQRPLPLVGVGKVLVALAQNVLETRHGQPSEVAGEILSIFHQVAAGIGIVVPEQPVALHEFSRGVVADDHDQVDVVAVAVAGEAPVQLRAVSTAGQEGLGQLLGAAEL